MKKILIPIVSLVTLITTSCSTLSKLNLNSNITSTALTFLTPVLLGNVPQDKQTEIKKYAATASSLLKTLDPSSLPNTQQFKAIVEQWIPAKYDTVISAVYTLYVTYVLPAESSKVQLRLKQIEDALDIIAGA